MEIKVAVIGPSNLVDLILKEGDLYTSLKLIPFKYNHPQETGEIVRNCKDKVDILLLSGPIAYENAISEVGTSKIISLSHNGAGLYRVFFQLLMSNKFKQTSLRFSIDILKELDIKEKLDEVDIVYEKMFVKEYSAGENIEDFTQFHYDLWLNNKIDVAITCVSSIYKRLTELKVPCYQFTPTKSSIQDCLYQVKLEGTNKVVSDTQIAIIIISLDSLLQNNKVNEYERERSKLDVGQVLIDFCEENQALFNWTERDEITLTTTKGALVKSTNDFKYFTFIHEIVGLGLSLSVGIGFGRTANEAEIKAKEALVKANLDKNNSCYMVTYDGNVVGPVGHESQLSYLTRSSSPELLERSNQTGLSIGTINKLISFCEKYGKTNITAAEIANVFGVSTRSARRILNKLELCELAYVNGFEQPVGRGRPRQLYNFNF